MAAGIDVLVHNIGHHDLYLCVNHDAGDVTVRPRGLGVQNLTEPLREALGTGEWTSTELGGRPHGVRLSQPIRYPQRARRDGRGS